MGLGPAYGGVGIAMADPVQACGADGAFVLTAASGVFEDVGGAVGRIRVVAPVTGRFIAVSRLHGAADGLPSEQKLLMRLTLDGAPIDDASSMVISNEISNNAEATCSCVMVLDLTAGQEVEVEVARSDGAQPASVVSGATGCTAMQLTQIPRRAHS